MGPQAPNGKFMKKCGVSGADSTYCLDSCGGYAGDTGDGYLYRYYLAGDMSDMKTNPTSPLPGADYFPHAPLCFKGCCPSGVTCSHKDVKTCGSSATAGTNGNFTVVALDGVTDKSTYGEGGAVAGSGGPGGVLVPIAVAVVVLLIIACVWHFKCRGAKKADEPVQITKNPAERNSMEA